MDGSRILPNELWIQTFSYLRRRDLKAIRLSGSRNLLYIASIQLFHNAYLALRRGVLETFVHLTTHPVLRHHVKEIIFDCSYLNPSLNADLTRGPSSLKHSAFLEEQERIFDYKLEAALKAAFRCIHGIRKVRYAELSRISCLPGDQYDASWKSDYAQGPLIHRVNPPTRDPERRIEELRRGAHHRGLVPLLKVLIKTVLTKPSSMELIELSLGNGRDAGEAGGIPCWYLPGHTFGGVRKKNYDIALLFRHLRKLDLTLDIRRSEGSLQVDLTQYLCISEHLEELKLVACSESDMLIFQDIFASHTWIKLRHVELVAVTAYLEELKSFIRRHANSLRCLLLDDFLLWNGEWKTLAKAMRSSAPLVELILGNICGSQSEWHMPDALPQHPLIATNSEYEDDDDNESSSDSLEYNSDDSSSKTGAEPRRQYWEREVLLLTGTKDNPIVLD
ncbi:hypothetical protein ACLMJK_005723 [Lecanora helva]